MSPNEYPKAMNGDGTTYVEPETPQTDTVFIPPDLDLNGHKWLQQGYDIIDQCATCPRYGIAVPGMLLVLEKGRYKLVDESRPELAEKRWKGPPPKNK